MNNLKLSFFAYLMMIALTLLMASFVQAVPTGCSYGVQSTWITVPIQPGYYQWGDHQINSLWIHYMPLYMYNKDALNASEMGVIYEALMPMYCVDPYDPDPVLLEVTETNCSTNTFVSPNYDQVDSMTSQNPIVNGVGEYKVYFNYVDHADFSDDDNLTNYLFLTLNLYTTWYAAGTQPKGGRIVNPAANDASTWNNGNTFRYKDQYVPHNLGGDPDKVFLKADWLLNGQPNTNTWEDIDYEYNYDLFTGVVCKTNRYDNGMGSGFWWDCDGSGQFEDASMWTTNWLPGVPTVSGDVKYENVTFNLKIWDRGNYYKDGMFSATIEPIHATVRVYPTHLDRDMVNFLGKICNHLHISGYDCGAWHCHRATLHAYKGEGSDNTGTDWFTEDPTHWDEGVPYTSSLTLGKGDIVTFCSTVTVNPKKINHSTTAIGSGHSVYMSNYTGGIFNVCQVSELLSKYSSSFVWKKK